MNNSPSELMQDESRVHANGDSLLFGLIVAGLPVAIAIGYEYARVSAALWVGTGLVAGAGALWFFARGTLFARMGMAVLSMFMVALHIHVGVGQNLYHFGVFVTLAVLLVYRDWRVPMMGAAIIALQHVLFNYLQDSGVGVTCFVKPSWSEVFIHAAYVVVQTAVEVWIALLLATEARRASEVQGLVIDRNGAINLRAREDDVSTDLAKSVSRALALMHRAVTQVKHSAAEILSTSRQLAQGNADLSQRTEQQASSLQQTAATIEELSSTVKQNSQSAREAADKAVGAADVAARGGKVVREVVGTMSQIEASSKKISDIIGIIDGIAFQTNILALNAAVEAARAGEQGRGFAVVAAEVRSLAQRSAAAARETKQLIDDSSQRVGAGSRLAEDAGKTMEEMVAAVQSVRDLIGDIAGASKEQLASIEEVSRAISQIELVTQRNASLVQDSAHAASLMAEQSDALAEAVAHFDTEGAAAPAATPSTALARPIGAARLLPG